MNGVISILLSFFEFSNFFSKEDLYFFGEKLSPKDKVKVGKENELGELKIRVGFDAENEEDLIDIQLVDLMGSAQVYRMMVDLLGDEDPEQRVLEIAEQFVQSFVKHHLIVLPLRIIQNLNYKVQACIDYQLILLMNFLPS